MQFFSRYLCGTYNFVNFKILRTKKLNVLCAKYYRGEKLNYQPRQIYVVLMKLSFFIFIPRFTFFS